MEPNPSVPSAAFSASGDSAGGGAMLASNGTSAPVAPPSQIDAQISESSMNPTVETSSQLESTFADAAEIEPPAERAKRKREGPFPACDSFMTCPEASNTVDIDFSSVAKRQKTQNEDAFSGAAPMTDAADVGHSINIEGSVFARLLSDVASLKTGVEQLLKARTGPAAPAPASRKMDLTASRMIAPNAPSEANPTSGASPAKSSSDLSKTCWARLISQSSGREIKLVGAAGSSLTIRDDQRVPLATLHIGNGRLFIEQATMNQMVMVNASMIRKGERFPLTDGDEVSFDAPATKKRSDFIYQQLVSPPKMAPTSAPAIPLGTHSSSAALQEAIRRRAAVAASPSSRSRTLEVRVDGQTLASLDLSQNPANRPSGLEIPTIPSLPAAVAGNESATPPDAIDPTRFAAEGIPSLLKYMVSRDRGLSAAYEPRGPLTAACSSDSPCELSVQVDSCPDDAESAAAPAPSSFAVSEPPPGQAEHADRVKRFTESLKAALVAKVLSPAENTVSLESFPYHLSDSLKRVLINSSFLYLEDPSLVGLVKGIKSVSRCMLLIGQHGTELYQDSLVRALGAHFNSSIVFLDDSLFTLADKMWKEIVGVPPAPAATASAASSAQPTDAMECDPPISTTDAPSAVAEAKPSQSAPRRFKVGDKVQFVGPSAGSAAERLHKHLFGGSSSSELQADSSHSPLRALRVIRDRERGVPSDLEALVDRASKMPPIGTQGEVCMAFSSDSRRVCVKSNAPFPGGIPIPQVCTEKLGFFCDASELRLASESSTQPDVIALDVLFEVIRDITKTNDSRVILNVKRLEKSLIQSFDRFIRFKTLVENVQGRAVVIGSACSSSVVSKAHASADKEHRPGQHGMLVLSRATQGLEILDQLNQIRGALSSGSPGESNMTSKIISSVFPSKLLIHPPDTGSLRAEWDKRIEQDTQSVRGDTNIVNITAALEKHGFECSGINKKQICDKVFSQSGIEKIAGYAISDHLIRCSRKKVEPDRDQVTGRIKIDSESVDSAIYMLKHSKPHKQKSVLDISTENPFEKQLLSDVIPPSELGVNFSDIGAHDKVKDTLKELVMLPLQRPELFRRGNLAKPCKGILLFGPPGTGKTMLAKAVATESGAHFINISMASVGSKWFGEGEKYARAVFTLASKLSPCVVFIDEVDAILGRRDKSGEHEAMRKIKNELMMMWDGLRSSDSERVLVLAATNRPMDLDEAVLRRLSRRLLVDLPDLTNRKKVLKVVLAKEEVTPCVNIDQIAELTEGFSGSDLKNLCVAAAYQPIRDLLAAEKQYDGEGAPPTLRPIQMSDFKHALTHIRPSVSEDAVSITELRTWNDQYGEGGNKGKTALPYFL